MSKNGGLIPASLGCLMLFVIILINYVIHLHFNHGLPTALTRDNIASGKDLFITERAKSDLIGLAQIGEKVVGSYANQVLAVEYLRDLLLEIQAEATNNKTVDVDVQTVSGAYFLDKTQGFTNVYFNMANVIARLSDGNGSSNALLVNCHFDSFPSSSGASDDSLNCAVMMEVLRVLSQSSYTLTHDVIFLFNGAEENSLEASHGFMKNHTWAADVRAVLNYDSCGYGGRETLFQIGPNNTWLIDYYAYVPHPQGNVIITNLFESGIIPSDTDFRIFRDHGGLIGMDMAHITGGYVYHTHFDEYQIIPDGTYQHTGDNMLALVKAMANAPELADTASSASGGAVYFDFLGLFFVRYSSTIAIIINISAVVLALCSPIRLVITRKRPMETALRYLISTIAQLVGLVIGIALAILFGMICDWCDRAMSWYNKPWIVTGLFVVPALLPMLAANWFLSFQPKDNRLMPGEQLQFNSEAMTFFWAVVLIGLTVYGLKSAYYLTMIVGFVALANVINSLPILQKNVKLWAPVHIIIGLLIPTVYSLGLGAMLVSMIPIMGRSGSQLIPDLYVSIIFGGLAVVIGSFWASLIGAIRHPQLLLTGFSIAAIVAVLAVLFTPLGFPYSVDPTEPMPQRFWLIHAERTIHDIDGIVTYNDGGYWLQNLDRNSPRIIEGFISEFSNAVDLEDACLDTVYCGMPLWKTREMKLLDKSVWIPAEAPTFPQYQPSTLIGIWNDTSSESRRLYLNVSGTDHMSFFFAPRTGVTLTSWSVLDEIPTANTWNGRSLYNVWYSYGKEPELPWQIWLDLMVPTGVSAAIDIVLNTHYLHNTTTTRVPYQSILDQLPVWVAPLHWTSTYKSYVF